MCVPSEAQLKLNSMNEGTVFLWNVYNVSFWKHQLHGDRIRSPVREERTETTPPLSDFVLLPRHTPMAAPMNMGVVIGKHMGDYPLQTYFYGPDGRLLWEETKMLFKDRFDYQKQFNQYYFAFTYPELQTRIKPLVATGLDDMVLLMVHYKGGQGYVEMKTEIEVLTESYRGYLSPTPPADGSWQVVKVTERVHLERRIAEGENTEFKLSILGRKPVWVVATAVSFPEDGPSPDEKTRFFWGDDFWMWGVSLSPEKIVLNIKIVTGEVVNTIRR